LKGLDLSNTNDDLPDSVAKALVDDAIDTLTGAIDVGREGAANELAQALREEQGEGFASIDPEPVKPEEAEAWLRSYLPSLVGVMAQDLRERVRDIIADGLARGLATRKIMKALRDELADFSANRIETIARTEITRAYNMGRVDLFRRNSSFVPAYQYSAVLDSRTTDICRNLHGRIIDATREDVTAFIPPLHFNCRGVLLPVTRYEEWQ